ncbi:endoplasmic reticulum protein [Phlyctochytrium arcticum]|nr:endoplasmic reticulum protein [Phlyctochytrium arcticum]
MFRQLIGKSLLGRPASIMSPIRPLSTGSRSDIVDISEIKKLVEGKSNEPYILIDVREPDEVKQGAIPTAKHIPLAEVPLALHLKSEEFKGKYGFEQPKRDDNVIFYCRSGKRSEAAFKFARQQGYENARNYRGSWLEWSAKNS